MRLVNEVIRILLLMDQLQVVIMKKQTWDLFTFLKELIQHGLKQHTLNQWISNITMEAQNLVIRYH